MNFSPSNDSFAIRITIAQQNNQSIDQPAKQSFESNVKKEDTNWYTCTASHRVCVCKATKMCTHLGGRIDVAKILSYMHACGPHVLRLVNFRFKLNYHVMTTDVCFLQFCFFFVVLCNIHGCLCDSIFFLFWRSHMMKLTISHTPHIESRQQFKDEKKILHFVVVGYPISESVMKPNKNRQGMPVTTASTRKMSNFNGIAACNRFLFVL